MIGNNNIPLAERLRPGDLEGYIGQEQLVGADGIIRKMIDNFKKRKKCIVLYVCL